MTWSNISSVVVHIYVPGIEFEIDDEVIIIQVLGLGFARRALEGLVGNDELLFFVALSFDFLPINALLLANRHQSFLFPSGSFLLLDIFIDFFVMFVVLLRSLL
jgi:hypothetical protein